MRGKSTQCIHNFLLHLCCQTPPVPIRISQNQTVVNNMSTYDIAEQCIHCGIDAKFEIESVSLQWQGCYCNQIETSENKMVPSLAEVSAEIIAESASASCMGPSPSFLHAVQQIKLQFKFEMLKIHCTFCNFWSYKMQLNWLGVLF